MDLQLDTRHAGAATVVAVRGEVDHFSAPQLRAELDSAVDAGAGTVVVDLSDTDFLDSSGLGALMALNKRLASGAGSLVVVCPQPHLRKLFAISHLDEVLAVRDSLNAALAG